MKTDLFINASSNVAESRGPVREAQAWRQQAGPALNSSPQGPLSSPMKAPALRGPGTVRLAPPQARLYRRDSLPVPPGRSREAARRHALAVLRAAELAAWQASGGDYLSRSSET